MSPSYSASAASSYLLGHTQNDQEAISASPPSGPPRIVFARPSAAVSFSLPNRERRSPLQMLSHLLSLVFGKRMMREYALRARILHRTRSSLRRPQLLSVRPRWVRDVGAFVEPNPRDSVIQRETVEGKANAFEMLLRFCESADDVAFLRSHPEYLLRLGIDQTQFPAVCEELLFFLAKRDQLREAEARVRERRKPKKGAK